MPGVENRTKVALLATVAGYGGAEKVVLTLIDRIDKERFEILPVIFTRPDQKDNLFFQKLDKQNTEYHKIYADSHRFKYLNPVANFFHLCGFIREHGCSLIHTHGYRADVLGIFASKLTSVPIISTCHGFISIDQHLSLYNRVDKFLLRFFNKIMAVSEAIKDELVESGVKASRIEVTPNAVDIDPDRQDTTGCEPVDREPLGIAQDDFVVGFVGRLSEEKGVGYLIEACSALRGSGVPVKLLIIGDGPETESLAALAERLKIRDDIVFTGFQPNVLQWILLMDLFVLPSLTEGTPMTVLEAMAAGVPVLATSVGGLPKVIDSGRNGLLVPPAEPRELRDAIVKLYRDAPLRERLAQEAVKTVRERYGLEDWVGRIEAEYSGLIEK